MAATITNKGNKTVKNTKPKDEKPVAQVAGNGKTDAEREEEFLAERMVEIMKKYKNVTPDSIRREVDGHHAGKLTVEITCKRKRKDENGKEYECGNKRRVATSDLFQVKYCEECIAELRLAKRRRKAKVNRAAKKEAGETTATVKAEGVKKVKAVKAEAAPKEKKPKLVAPKKKMRNVEEVAAEAEAKRKLGESASKVPDEGSIEVEVAVGAGADSSN